jgi:hypothetical protein
LDKPVGLDRDRRSEHTIREAAAGRSLVESPLVIAVIVVIVGS